MADFCNVFFLPHQSSPVNWAADEGHVDTVMCLVEKGAKINSKDEIGVGE